MRQGAAGLFSIGQYHRNVWGQHRGFLRSKSHCGCIVTREEGGISIFGLTRCVEPVLLRQAVNKGSRGSLQRQIVGAKCLVS